jgi:hypothetical protein
MDGQAANLEDEKGGCDSRMGVDGCCGVHGVASLCGGRVRLMLTQKVILSTENNLNGYFCENL